jgi:hypothetical protein
MRRALLGVILVAAAARPHAQARSNEEALKLSQACADSAASFWHRHGYDKASKSGPGEQDFWSYASHYNRGLSKCLVAVRLKKILPSHATVFHEVIGDAIEGGEPIAWIQTVSDKPIVFLNRGHENIKATPWNLAWYRGLMTQ